MTTGLTNRSRALALSARSSHYLYRCYDAAGRLLYIGCTTDPQARERAHIAGKGRGSKPIARHLASFVVDADAYGSRETAQAAEAAAIFAEQPIFNFQGRGLPHGFVKAQIADYEAGREIRQWPRPFYAPPCARRAIATT